MSGKSRILALVAVAALATPARAQDRNIQFQLMGGGYSHTTNLNTVGSNAHFKVGYTLATALGINLNKYVGVHGDFTFARTQALGNLTFDGKDVNRFFYGGHVELRYPVTENFAPFVFGGGGAVTIDQAGAQTTELFNHFTKAAGMFGVGLAYSMPGTPIDLLAEGKALTYKWVSTGFSRQQWDVTYTAGFAYRFRF